MKTFLAVMGCILLLATFVGCSGCVGFVTGVAVEQENSRHGNKPEWKASLHFEEPK